MQNFKFRASKIMKNKALMLVICIFGALAALALISLLVSGVLLTLEDPGASIGVGALAALLCSAAVSGFAVAKINGEGGVKLSMIAHLIAAVLLLLFGLVIGGGVGGLMNAVCYLGVAALFSLLGKKRAHRPRRR